MKDRFDREINYIRVSVTDRCNYRCIYCMPPGGIECVPMKEVLTFEEIRDFCREAAALGISRVKLTGGEPLVRRGLPKLVGMLHEIPGIRQVTLTTNGALLEKHLDALLANHLDAVNISLDTLRPTRFREITRGGDLADVLQGLRAAIGAGIPVKVNTVLYEGEDWKELPALAREHPVDVRFIEVMPIGRGCSHTGAGRQEVLRYLSERYGELSEDHAVHGNGPAVYYRLPHFQGSIGLIAPIHGTFCAQCNRIRLSATGQLKPCLCFGETTDIRAALRNEGPGKVREILQSVIEKKPQAHCFPDQKAVTEKRPMVSIGG